MAEEIPSSAQGADRVDLRGAAGPIFRATGPITQTFGYTAEQVNALPIAQVRRAGQPRVWDGRPPYLGLAAFQVADAEFFFGRERWSRSCLGESRPRASSVSPDRLALVSRPSPRPDCSTRQIGRLDGSEKWLYTSFSPLSDPIEQLAQAMARMARDPGQAAYLRERGKADSHALHQQAEVLLSHRVEQRAVIYVDQFEEVFSRTGREEEHGSFLDLLTTAAEWEDGRVTVLISMRSDFITQCATYPALRGLISQQFQLVGAMTPEELTQAIALPALAVGAEIEPELVAQVIADMKGEPGALPLMQFALRDLFDSLEPKPGQQVKLKLSDYLARGASAGRWSGMQTPSSVD